MSDGETSQYPLRWRGRQSGPYPVSEINRMLDEHEIGMGHEILYQDKWIVLEEFFAATSQTTPAPITPPTENFRSPGLTVSPREITPAVSFKVSVSPAQRDPNAAPARPRNRLVFAFLAICLGFLGLHNFYARQWLTGLLQLLLSVATSLMGFGIIASWLWAMVEALVVSKDGSGAEMT
jgi:TM2 domain-containing membrane protein YozV